MYDVSCDIITNSLALSTLNAKYEEFIQVLSGNLAQITLFSTSHKSSGPLVGPLAGCCGIAADYLHNGASLMAQ